MAVHLLSAKPTGPQNEKMINLPVSIQWVYIEFDSCDRSIESPFCGLKPPARVALPRLEARSK